MDQHATSKEVVQKSAQSHLPEMVTTATMDLKERKGLLLKKNKKHHRHAEDELTCTVCFRRINPNNPDDLNQHPVLKVLTCKRCHGYYTGDDIVQDSTGMDEQCRWCAEGGQLVCCDYCHNAFCKMCITHNLGHAEWSTVIDADDIKWQCYVCEPKPLAELVGKAVDAMAKRRQFSRADAVHSQLHRELLLDSNTITISDDENGSSTPSDSDSSSLESEDNDEDTHPIICARSLFIAMFSCVCYFGVLLVLSLFH